MQFAQILLSTLTELGRLDPSQTHWAFFVVIESFDGVRPNKEEDGVILLDRGWFSKTALVVILV